VADIAVRLLVIVAYLLFSLSVVGAAAFAIGVTTDAPLAAVGGALLMMILCAILDSIPALADIRQGLTGHYAFAWADALADHLDYSDMITGAPWSIGYAIVLVAFAVWHFLRKGHHQLTRRRPALHDRRPVAGSRRRHLCSVAAGTIVRGMLAATAVRAIP
jgi:hypothetical protein